MTQLLMPLQNYLQYIFFVANLVIVQHNAESDKKDYNFNALSPTSGL